ncbi:MAG: hypothetical protein Q7T86_06870 [Hyphomicrobiaceae bacterium]|jgi:hypothetical protein|nr:hypothetical protein [Hyphomicrobiaceae bacterium]
MAKYIPPHQSKFGQVFDVLVVLALTVGALYIPLWLKMAGATKTPAPIENPTWEALGQNPTMVERWQALGYPDPASANELITARFDYSFDWLALAAMVALVVGYFVMVVRFSDKEYREVINEKFGEKR